jgi:ABC-type phosphate transport system substrate-binding protein
MENWYELNEFGPEAQAFVGTDNPPNEAVKNKIEARGTGGKVLTIPTLQASIAIIVHLPTGCTAEATKGGPGATPIKRLVLSQHSVEALFRGVDTKWTQVKDGGDKLVGCTKAVQETAIKRVVREDGSGTTATFKKSLELINGKGEAEAGKVCNDAKTLTWLQCAEEPPANTVWPKEAEDLRGNGSGGVIEKVELTPSSVGYVNLANARAGKGHGVLPGGEGQAGFWAPVENGHTEVVGGTAKKIYADPANNGDNATAGKANCEETEYVAIVPKSGKAEKGKFPPSSTEKVWNIVSAEKKETHYSFCGFTYDLALTKYNGFSGATVGEATTAGDFLEFVLNAASEGGQKLIGENHDYEALPTNAEPKKNVQKIAQEGAAKVQF